MARLRRESSQRSFLLPQSGEAAEARLGAAKPGQQRPAPETSAAASACPGGRPPGTRRPASSWRASPSAPASAAACRRRSRACWRGRPSGRACREPIAFIMSAICRCIFSSLLISSTLVPEPAAMRFLRLALRRSGFRRSSGVIESMIAICRLSSALVEIGGRDLASSSWRRRAACPSGRRHAAHLAASA